MDFNSKKKIAINVKPAILCGGRKGLPALLSLTGFTKQILSLAGNARFFHHKVNPVTLISKVVEV